MKSQSQVMIRYKKFSRYNNNYSYYGECSTLQNKTQRIGRKESNTISETKIKRMKNVNLQMSMFLHITLAAEIDPTEGPTYK
jgi:hypothetical protein